MCWVYASLAAVFGTVLGALAVALWWVRLVARMDSVDLAVTVGVLRDKLEHRL